jgi:hypothetical protein
MHLHGIVAKKFAVCLTHDVDRVKKVINILRISQKRLDLIIFFHIS